MSTPINDGGSAFPQDLQGRRGDDPSLQGMSTRTWLAGMVFPQLLTMPTPPAWAAHSAEWRLQCAAEAMSCADDMLTAITATPEAKAPRIERLVTDNPISAIVYQMDLMGGEFVRRLAAAMLAADGENLAKIIAAFPDIIARYDAFASNARKDYPAEITEQ